MMSSTPSFLPVVPAGFANRWLRSSLVAAVTLLCVHSGRAEPWTVEQAVATALEHSPDARIARARIEGARSLVEQAGAAWLPQLNVSSRYTETNSPMMAFGAILNQRAFGPTIDFNHPGQIDNLNATGTVGYNLYSGGRAQAGRVAARAGTEAAELDLRATQQQLAAAVVKAVLDLRKAREARAAMEAGVKAYDAAVAVAQARFEAGQMLRADLLSLQVQAAQTREALSAARHGAALAARAFRYVLGLEASSDPVELAAADPVLAQLAVPENRDVSRRPELQALRARMRAAEAMVDVARGARRPTVNAFASYQYDKGWELGRDATGWMAGVAVDLNVFDGGQTSGKIRQNKAELIQLKEMTRKLTLALELEAEQARLAHADAVERLAVAEAAVGQAEESAALTRARFEKQSVLMADVIGAESRLIEAKLRKTFAAADERLAIVELRRAVGLGATAAPGM